MCSSSHSSTVSWMLLWAKGHSCLSSRLLFSSTNWCCGRGNGVGSHGNPAKAGKLLYPICPITDPAIGTG